MEGRDRPYLVLFVLPALVFFAAFFLLPMARLVAVGTSGPGGPATYAAIIATPRYFRSLGSTLVLSLLVTGTTLVIAGIAGAFLVRNGFSGWRPLVALVAFPIAFAGVAVGF